VFWCSDALLYTRVIIDNMTKNKNRSQKQPNKPQGKTAHQGNNAPRKRGYGGRNGTRAANNAALVQSGLVESLLRLQGEADGRRARADQLARDRADREDVDEPPSPRQRVRQPQGSRGLEPLIGHEQEARRADTSPPGRDTPVIIDRRIAEIRDWLKLMSKLQRYGPDGTHTLNLLHLDYLVDLGLEVKLYEVRDYYVKQWRVFIDNLEEAFCGKPMENCGADVRLDAELQACIQAIKPALDALERCVRDPSVPNAGGTGNGGATGGGGDSDGSDDSESGDADDEELPVSLIPENHVRAGTIPELPLSRQQQLQVAIAACKSSAYTRRGQYLLDWTPSGCTGPDIVLTCAVGLATGCAVERIACISKGLLYAVGRGLGLLASTGLRGSRLSAVAPVLTQAGEHLAKSNTPEWLKTPAERTLEHLSELNVGLAYQGARGTLKAAVEELSRGNPGNAMRTIAEARNAVARESSTEMFKAIARDGGVRSNLTIALGMAAGAAAAYCFFRWLTASTYTEEEQRRHEAVANAAHREEFYRAVRQIIPKCEQAATIDVFNIWARPAEPSQIRGRMRQTIERLTQKRSDGKPGFGINAATIAAESIYTLALAHWPTCVGYGQVNSAMPWL